MTSETFEQVLAAAEADGSFTPAWRKFVNTKFFVAVMGTPGGDGNSLRLHVAGGVEPAVHISEVRERLAQPHGGTLAALSGADVVRLLHAEAAIMVALSDRAFNIAKERVDWLKKGIEASQARAVAKAREAAQAAASPSPSPSAATASAAAPSAPVTPVTPVTPAAAPAAAPVSIAKPAPAIVPGPPVPRKTGGMLDVAALKPRPVTFDKIGLEFFVPGDWREARNPSGIQFNDDVSGTVVKASGSHRADTTLTKWLATSMSLVQHDMRFLTQDGEPYALDGEGWRDRVKGMATEYYGTFPGDDVPSRYLLACIRIEGTVASIAIRAPAQAFEDNRLLYKWLLSRLDLVPSAATPVRAPIAGNASRQYDDSDAPETPLPWGLSLTGRISRLQALAYSFPVWTPFILMMLMFPSMAQKSMMMPALVMLSSLAVTMWLSLRLTVLRLHDANISGKWILYFIGLVVVAMLTRSYLFVGLAVGGGTLVAFVFYSLVPGSEDDNDYGPPPGPNTTLVKIGAGLFIALHLMSFYGQGKLAQSGKYRNMMSMAGANGDDSGSVAFMPPDASFVVTMPAQPDEVPMPAIGRGQMGRAATHMYQLTTPGAAYMAQTIDYGTATIDQVGAMDALQATVIGRDGALIESKLVLMNGFKGREVRASMFDGTVRASRFVIVGAKIRMVTIQTGKDAASTARIEAFLTSFKLP